MTETFQCGDNTALVGYLYDECEPHERTAIAAHVTVCAACAAELAALKSTRVQLAAWSPPEAELGFLITQRQTPQPLEFKREAKSRHMNWFARPFPAWAQVAAATVVFAVGMFLGIATRAGAPSQIRAAAVTQAGSSVVVSDQVASDQALAALERRLRDEIAAVRTANQDTVTTVATSPSSSGNEAQLMARVRGLIEESEQRQRRELALRTAELVRDFDSQRRVDLAQIQRNFGQIEGLTGAEVREQREMLNYLMRVSQQQR
jgi:anti-sigma factor RsiW